MASQWDWIFDFESQVLTTGDVERFRLAMLRQVAQDISHDAPDEKLAIYAAGRELARQLGEPWWEMFYEHWFIEVLLFGKHEPKRALDHAARAVFETSKPIYNGFPQRVSLQMNLAAAYRGIDPIGYESELRALFGHIEASCNQYPDNRAYYAQLWSDFLELVDDPGAIDAAFRYLQLAEESGADHYIWDAISTLCTTLYRFDRESARLQLGDLAAIGEPIARRETQNRGVVTFLMWRALAARWDGDEVAAARFYRRAMQLQAKLAPPRNNALFGAMAFHEAGGEWEKALQICHQDIRLLRKHGLTFIEAQRRLEKCRFLKVMGRSFSKDAQRLRRVAEKLKSKAHWENRLRELESGE